MEALFLKLLNLSLTAGWLILAVVVLRLIFRKAPRWVFCLLWGLAALRLVCPVTVESVVSLIPSAQPIPADIVYQAAPAIDSGIPAVNQVVNPVLSTAFTPTPAASVNPLQVVTAVAAWVWLAGLILMAVYALISYLLLRRRVATATLLRENIKQSERVDSPFVLGLFRPTVYLPYSMEEADMGHVIAHERAHIRRGDHWWKPLGFLILAVYWFNPLVWVAYILFCRDMELACDEKVAAHMAHEERQAYSTALLHCGVRRRTVAACPLAFGEVGVKSRVKSVMNYKKPAFWVVLIAVLVCIAAAVCFLTVPKDDGPHTLELTGLPAPESNADPYADLEPTQRAEAFLKNADTMSYERPLLMYGEYVMITMEYKPRTEQLTDPASGTTFTHTFDHTKLFLDDLQKVDLTALRQMEPAEIESFDIQVSSSGLLHVGDARCRAAVWCDQKPALVQEYTAALVFTFSDGTVCAFEEKVPGSGSAASNSANNLADAISIAGSATSYALVPQGGDVAVEQLSTGKTGGTSAYGAAWITCIFKNTPRLAPRVDDHSGTFDYRVTLADGSVYLFDNENLLLQTADGSVYPIGGFENQEGSFTMESLISGLVTGGFGTS